MLTVRTNNIFDQGHHYVTLGTVSEKCFFQSKNKYQAIVHGPIRISREH